VLHALADHAVGERKKVFHPVIHFPGQGLLDLQCLFQLLLASLHMQRDANEGGKLCRHAGVFRREMTLFVGRDPKGACRILACNLQWDEQHLG
jgi:hypothetical protein